MMNILLTSSDLYYPFIQVTLYSIISNNPNEKIDFYILSDNITNEHKETIKKNENENISMNFIEVSDLVNKFELNEIQREYLMNSPIPITSRLFLTKLLPESVDKIISLDSDVLVVDSIRKLWNINIDNYYYAGVKDLMPTAFTESIGLTENNNYLNTGILLINLKKIRTDKKDREFLDFITKNYNLYMHYDQGIINAVCKDAMLVIHPKFNYIGSLHTNKPYNLVKWYVNPKYYYDKKTILEAKNNTVIYHFCEGSLGRPWTNNNHLYYNLYKEYVLKSGIDQNTIYITNIEKPFISKLFLFLQTNKIFSFILNIIPASITRKITNHLIKERIK